ncbi:alpha/beta fold hydrolase [Actinomadura barringtoniae]|uniref:Alpha/beta fold hydrolase n=1 Tax=Actinomadura barringtoniae TaxID=1427535 RepID=A0A939PCE6_9ACTN|nr:alpha/beta fold hydrolase [Actinomadura barringtoniae]MBO2450045.1 alpha/beta fold hydrolase [Actinomadura barringtoniae]
MRNTNLIVGAAAFAVIGGVVAAPSSASAGGLDRYYKQHLAWKACTQGPDDEVGKELDKAGARCADVTVPLDYANPGGRTIKIAISRLTASDPAHRIGTMLINGGGPGPAIDMPPYMKGVMGEAGPRFDLVGMDPRSLGRSAGVDCGWPSATWIRPAGLTRGGFDRQVTFEKDLAKRCEQRGGDVMPYISTANIARDMDVVRGALGERKLSYNGASYGTYLGAVYATLFGDKVDRMVLDSAVDPARWSPTLLRGTEGANEQALAHWATWTAARNAKYGLGTSQAKVLASVHRIQRAALRKPLSIGTYKVDDAMMPGLLFAGLQDDRDEPRASLAESVAIFDKAARTGETVQPSADLEDGLKFMLTGDESRYGSGQAAIICGDASAPRDVEGYWRDIQRVRKSAPLFGPLTYATTPCTFWPRPPREKPVNVTTSVPALIVAATGDTRTTYASSQGLYRAMSGSRLITLRGADVHAPYQAGYGNACVNDLVNRYQVTGVLPAGAPVCEK